MYAVKALLNSSKLFPGSLLSFQLEKEILQRITCKNVPRFIESFSYDEVNCIVQEYIPGWPLSYLIDTGYYFSEKEVKDILRQLLAILKELHCPLAKENAVVHRDIRLSNLLLYNGKLYLVDFGLARFLDPRQFPFCPNSTDNSPAGSNLSSLKEDTHYNRGKFFEQKIPGHETYRLMRTEISPRSDLFGVGIVGVDLFTNLVEDESQFELPWDKVLTMSESFMFFLKKLLSRKKGFKTAEEALNYLESLPQ